MAMPVKPSANTGRRPILDGVRINSLGTTIGILSRGEYKTYLSAAIPQGSAATTLTPALREFIMAKR